MPRLRQVSRAEVTDPVTAYVYQRKFGDRDPVAEPGTASGAPGNWETVFAQSPDLLEHAMRGFQAWQSPNRKLDPILRELAITRVGWVCGCQFAYSQHCKVLRGEGADEACVAAIPHWQVSSAYTAPQRAVLAYVDCLCQQHGRTPDALFDELKRHLDEEQILELTYFTSMYIMHSTMTRALRLEFDDRPDPIVEVPAPPGYAYRPGAAPLNLPSR
ncbi:MAG TPA: carboxymuconolactone decarboxylase family protein [Steroidobacter sp.]|uniref:carboxymuconolactone decarboxylase family protein n=1 Tax=Steroidobacter sp. TaxID=1978227 RepID=UPI002EDA0895